MNTPLSESLHIVIAGNTNAGKSSLFNALFRTSAAVVSTAPGTTTDPVTRKIELAGLGPCSITDTAGLDDTTELGTRRIEKSLSRILIADLVLFATPADRALTPSEQDFFHQICQRSLPVLVIFTFFDRKDAAILKQKESFFRSAETKAELKFANFSNASKAAEYVPAIYTSIESFQLVLKKELTPVEDIVRAGSTVILVTPIDTAAPKGRLILPQVETLRDLLDRDCNAIVVKENGLQRALEGLKNPPDLVITDSQAFSEVSKLLPPDQPLTSFSILFARKKGDFEYFMNSLSVLGNFPKAGKVLIMEACAHHQKDDDIGTVKIPNILKNKFGNDIQFTFSRDVPPSLEGTSRPDLVITCGACMLTRNQLLNRIEVFKNEEIPVLNYGIFLAWANGLIPRTIEPLKNSL